uniref:Pantothenate kinase n=1 Tax=Guillardia theta TaxID=55529 RepID=A0A7S4K3A2_GUITH|mmetsp:Transcript_20745/g.69301  ORF Transcript_20745/g.69301 Transcript_20745/m.69301 type:complete len:474 (+) Transcript_20745:180-1601(+)
MQHVNDEKAFKEQRGAAKSNCAFKNGEADGNSASRSNSQEALNGLEMRGLDEDNDNDARLKLYRRDGRRSRSRSLDDIRAELLPRTSSPSCGRNSFLPEGMLFGIDIGGTLAKIVFREPGLLAQGPKSEQAHRLRQYFQTSEGRVGSEDERLYFSDSLGVFGGKMHFLKLETSSIDFLFEILRKERQTSPHEVTQWKIYATGGGSFKYEARFKDLGIKVRKSDEMETIVSGVLCAIENIPDECFTWVPPDTAGDVDDDMRLVRQTIQVEKARKPWLVVNVGSGVSMLKLDEQMTVDHGKVGTYKRVGGTPVGGGTFLALGCLLTGAKSHLELLELAARGNAKAVDKLVGDIYGEDYQGLGLSAHTVASSFGKLVNAELRSTVSNEDLAASLVQMISWNIAHLARLVACQEGARTIIFTGSFMHNNEISQRKFAAAFRYWSNGDSQALFMRHEGYVGALGALAMSTLIRQEHTH